MVSSFATRQLPARASALPGPALGYHYLSNLDRCDSRALGLERGGAAALFVGDLRGCSPSRLFAFQAAARRHRSAAILCSLVSSFLLGGGAGSARVTTIVRIFERDRRPARRARTAGWTSAGQTEHQLPVGNMFYGFWMSQRAFLYGMPLAFLVIRRSRGLGVATSSAPHHGANPEAPGASIATVAGRRLGDFPGSARRACLPWVMDGRLRRSFPSRTSRPCSPSRSPSIAFCSRRRAAGSPSGHLIRAGGGAPGPVLMQAWPGRAR